MASNQINRNLVLIGNGFDLAHGLDTRYGDFIKSYTLDVLDRASKSGIDDTEWSITKGKAKNIQSLIPFKSNSREPEIKSHNRFLNLISDSVGENWTDFEGIYYKELRKWVDSSDYESALAYIIKLNEDFERIKGLLLDYLDKENEKLQKEKSVANPQLESILYDIVRSVSLATIFNFNYTSTLNCYFSGNSRNRVKHIHGSLDNKKKNPPVLGFGDTQDDHYRVIENLNNNNFLEFSKYRAYALNSSYDELELFLSDSSHFDVHIIGLSCGITDRVLLSTILEHNLCNKIHVYYYKNQENFLHTITNISRVFKDKRKFIKRLVKFEESEMYAE